MAVGPTNRYRTPLCQDSPTSSQSTGVHCIPTMNAMVSSVESRTRMRPSANRPASSTTRSDVSGFRAREVDSDAKLPTMVAPNRIRAGRYSNPTPPPVLKMTRRVLMVEKRCGPSIPPGNSAGAPRVFSQLPTPDRSTNPVKPNPKVQSFH